MYLSRLDYLSEFWTFFILLTYTYCEKQIKSLLGRLWSSENCKYEWFEVWIFYCCLLFVENRDTGDVGTLRCIMIFALSWWVCLSIEFFTFFTSRYYHVFGASIVLFVCLFFVCCVSCSWHKSKLEYPLEKVPRRYG